MYRCQSKTIIMLYKTSLLQYLCCFLFLCQASLRITCRSEVSQASTYFYENFRKLFRFLSQVQHRGGGNEQPAQMCRARPKTTTILQLPNTSNLLSINETVDIKRTTTTILLLRKSFYAEKADAHTTAMRYRQLWSWTVRNSICGRIISYLINCRYNNHRIISPPRWKKCNRDFIGQVGQAETPVPSSRTTGQAQYRLPGLRGRRKDRWERHNTIKWGNLISPTGWKFTNVQPTPASNFCSQIRSRESCFLLPVYLRFILLNHS